MTATGKARRRRVVNALACAALGGCVAVALVPLVLVLAYTVRRGASAISWEFLTHSMNGVGPRDVGGGAYHAILGTLEQVGLACAVAVPIGLLVAIHLAEHGDNRFTTTVRFVVDVMTGVPSIVAGLFVYSFWVLGLGRGYSGLAAAFALAVLMLPVVVRSAEEMLRLVPDELREASWALGVPRWRTTVSVVVPAAAPGIATGVTLAIARVTGETAPLLLTAFGFDAIRSDPLEGPQSALPLFVFSQAGQPYDPAVRRAWAGALTLVVVVVLLTLLARAVARRAQARG